MQSAKTTALVMLVITGDVFRAADDDDDDTSKWTRLCTFTSEGGSRHNVSMPCGVQVKSESIEAEGNGDDEGPINYVRVDVKDVRGVGATQDGSDETQDNDGDETHHDDDETQGDSVKGLDKTRTDDRGVETGNPVGLGQTVDTRLEDNTSDVTGNRDEAVNDYEGEHYEDDVRVEVDDYDVSGDDGDEREEQLESVPVKTVVLSYLHDAKNQLFNKIHYLLSLLQNAFFNARLDSHRSRRNLIDRRIALNTEGRQTENNKQQFLLNNISAFLKPSFERSMMTMSFLMFGVFIIQIVQRLMQTLQKSSEIMSMGNPVQGNLPTV